MNFNHTFAPAPFDKVPIVISVVWIIVSASVILFPRRFVLVFTRGAIELPPVAIWICRLLGVVNVAGAIHFLILFQK